MRSGCDHPEAHSGTVPALLFPGLSRIVYLRRLFDRRAGLKTMRKKILAVEDDADLLDLLRLSFKGAGFSVATAGNGIDALKKARSLEPDLILLDLVLPELDGFAVCETLRKSPATATVPIIVLTGLSSELARLAVLECGASDYVTKPVTPSELITKMRHWLRRTTHAAPPRRAAPSHSRLRASVH